MTACGRQGDGQRERGCADARICFTGGDTRSMISVVFGAPCRAQALRRKRARAGARARERERRDLPRPRGCGLSGCAGIGRASICTLAALKVRLTAETSTPASAARLLAISER
eukprot:1635622-Prymnesium_polylepis.1